MIEEIEKIVKDRFIRNEVKDGVHWHVKDLCYCRHRVLNEKAEVNERVIIGLLVHYAIENLFGKEPESYIKNIGKYIIIGTPDLVFDDVVVELKFASYEVKSPREHDVLQLKLYLWLLSMDKGILCYLTPFGFKEFEVGGGVTTEEVLALIESPRYPFWSWECKYCSLYPCVYVSGEVTENENR